MTGFSVGGLLDSHMRLMSDRLATALGQPVIHDRVVRRGAGPSFPGTTGVQALLKSKMP